MRAAPLHRCMTALSGAVLMAGCAQDTDLAAKCVAGVRPAGSYEYAAGSAEPVVMPAEGGTQAGADAVNACIQRNVRDSGLKPGMAATSQGMGLPTAMANGQVVMRTVTVEAPQPAALAAPLPAAGNLPLPTQYPLMAGDRALWFSMTRAQQQQALTYLQSGSTIRSSLGAN